MFFKKKKFSLRSDKYNNSLKKFNMKTNFTIIKIKIKKIKFFSVHKSSQLSY